jgi:hypothetical protein
MLMRHLATLGLLLLLTGCASSSAVKDERSAAITATGAASIENWRSPVMKTTRVFVTHVDGEFLQTSGQRGVYSLQPGRHTFTVQVHFSRLVPQLIIDAGLAQLELEAHAGARYRLRAEKAAGLVAEVWIENAATGEIAVPRTQVDLAANPQDVPLIVPIPV